MLKEKNKYIYVDITTKINLEKGKAVAFDFDGVIHKYSKGWQDGSIYDDCNAKVFDIIRTLMLSHVPVYILSTREPEQIREWWNAQRFGIPCTVIEDTCKFWTDEATVGITNRKLPAQMYVDDKAYKYNGENKEDFFCSLQTYQ